MSISHDNQNLSNPIHKKNLNSVDYTNLKDRARR